MPREAVQPAINAYFWDGKGTSPFHSSPIVDTEPRQHFTVYVRKDAPFRHDISMKLLHMKAAGLMDYKFVPDVMDMFHTARKVEK